MNERKWKQLLAAARRESPPVPADDFAAGVLRAIRHAGPVAPVTAGSLLEQLNALFPRLAWAAAAVIILSLATDWALTAAGIPPLSDSVSQISAHWFLTPNGF